MKYFLVVYRRSTAYLLDCQDLGEDPKGATAKRLERELRERADPDVEVVVLSAPSKEALVETHSRYFKTASQLATALARSTG